MSMNTFQRIAEAARKRLPYAVTNALLEFSREILAKMRSDKVSKAELARRMETSPSYITKLLGGQNNFTLETMVKMAWVMDSELQLRIVPKGTSVAAACSGTPHHEGVQMVPIKAQTAVSISARSVPTLVAKAESDQPSTVKTDEQLALAA